MGSMEIRRVTSADHEAVAALVDVRNAAEAVDAPWQRPGVVSDLMVELEQGWDGEPPEVYAGTVAGEVLVSCSLELPEYDNRHLAWVEVAVTPTARRRGLGSQLLEHAQQRAREAGRRSVGSAGWDTPAARGFAGRHGFQVAAREVKRRLTLPRADRTAWARRTQDARRAAVDYELVRLTAPTPEEWLEPVMSVSAAINDAPTDDLDVEDETFPPERIRAFESALSARGCRLYRVLATHRRSGEVAGHTALWVESARPGVAVQHDTAVAREHRGHRLGMLLKLAMLQWLDEVEPGIAEIDTWNAESNRHMIAINEALGFAVCGRALEFQRSL